MRIDERIYGTAKPPADGQCTFARGGMAGGIGLRCVLDRDHGDYHQTWTGQRFGMKNR